MYFLSHILVKFLVIIPAIIMGLIVVPRMLISVLPSQEKN
jgi:hypothetical protein